VLRDSAVKLELPIEVIGDAILYANQFLNHQNTESQISTINSEQAPILLCACMLLSAKVNEQDRVRLRDILNVTYFSINELNYINQKSSPIPKDSMEVD